MLEILSFSVIFFGCLYASKWFSDKYTNNNNY